MRNAEPRKLLVLCRFANIERIAESGSALQDALIRLSDNRGRIAFTASTTLAYLLMSDLSAKHLHNALEGYTSLLSTAPVRNGDSLLVLELGKDFCGSKDFIKAAEWLQHN